MSKLATQPQVQLANEFAGAGLSTPAPVARENRYDLAWVIVKRGAGGSGAVTVANAYLVGQDVAGHNIRIATLGSMNIAAGEDGYGVLVPAGIGAFPKYAFNCDAIVGDTIDVYLTFVED